MSGATSRRRTATLAGALLLEATVGEPPARLHPVVAMGQLVDLLERRVCVDGPPPAARRAGLVAAGLGSAVVLAVAALVERLPWPVRATALWTMVSGRMLLREVTAVEDTLTRDGVEAGRDRLSWLVSRPTAELTEPQVRAAAVQTLAENTTDAWTATLWWWSVAGLPGAALHRWADTLDSRWGYRDAARADRGRAAARADDLAAWIPARLTGLLWRGRLDAPLRREAARTPSPNGGWTMGAAALATDSRLEKPGAYVLHPDGRTPDHATVDHAVRDARRVLVSTAALALLAAAVTDRPRGA